MKAYVVTESMKNAKEYFEGEIVLQGLYNCKPAVYISASYSDKEMENVIEMYLAISNKYMCDFVATKLVEMCEAKGKFLIVKYINNISR